MWLLRLSIMFSRFIYVVVCIDFLFLSMAEEHSIVWIDHILFIYSTSDRHLGFFVYSCAGGWELVLCLILEVISFLVIWNPALFLFPPVVSPKFFLVASVSLSVLGVPTSLQVLPWFLPSSHSGSVPASSSTIILVPKAPRPLSSTGSTSLSTGHCHLDVPRIPQIQHVHVWTHWPLPANPVVILCSFFQRMELYTQLLKPET